jgi:hypothetical protein
MERTPTMSDTVDRTLYREEEGVDGKAMPGGGPEGQDLHEPRSRDRVVTSSGTAPTGVPPVGGASDRVIPSRETRERATNANVGAGALDPAAGTAHDRPAADGGDPGPLD